MPIRFNCPACRSAFTVTDADAGKKAACPTCGQRLHVPVSQRLRTVLAEEAPVLVRPTPAAPVLVRELPESAPPSPAPAPAYAAARDPIPPLPSLPTYTEPERGRLTGAGIGVLAAVAVVLLVGTLVMVFVLASRRAREMETPVVDREPAKPPKVKAVPAPHGLSTSCTLPELVERLFSNGVGSAVQYLQVPNREAKEFAWPDRDSVPCAFIDGGPGSCRITIIECADDLTAKHTARSIQTEGKAEGQKDSPDRVFAWGRFFFAVVEGPTGQKIKRLLGA